ncbi:proline-rich protein 36-like [Melanotaenia boesemani]|uniref:proline-rich protein 36-like n=1 Tax=Melanotaenia boesemani TaxID=1250792 RepID=UPI001C05C558|nr:proline-rich protein 36-like [Melanotaenia boesemani]
MEYHSGGSLPLLGRPRYCPGASANGGYLCETGHCCGETGCCTYYYELWWFWLLWTVLILFSCCCAYRHRRAKLRVQQQQRQREISLLAYHGANSFPSSMLDLSFLASLKLPSYEEVAAQPSTPPPPYSSVFTTPRYPQPPRAADPHLLTQHGPLLHRPLSDGPSSLSSDNSSSCSCDSCCPSSPCSSSLSAPVTYETDTSHASTPSEATPLTLDVTMETIAAAASCLEAHEAQCVSERMGAAVAVDIKDPEGGRAQEPVAKDSSVPSQTVTVAVVTRAASPQSLPSPGPQLNLPLGTTSPTKQHLDIAPCSPFISTGSSSHLPSPSVVDPVLPSIKIMSTESTSGPPTPTAYSFDSCRAANALETLSVTRTLDPASVPCSPTSVSPSDAGRTFTLITTSASFPTPDHNTSLMLIPAPTTLSQTPVPTTLTQDQEPLLSDRSGSPNSVHSELILIPNPPPKTPVVPDSTINTILTPNLTRGTDAASISFSFTQSQNSELSPGSCFQIPPSPGSSPSQHSGSVVAAVSCLDLSTAPVRSEPLLVPNESSESDLTPTLPSDVQVGFRSDSGSESSPLSDSALTCPASSCPSITVESEISLTASHAALTVISPSSPRSPPSFPAPALLLDPLTALHQSDKGGSSSGHASSLSPSPRATQSPPKQTVFSPCVDIFEPGPPCWEDEQEEKDNDEDEDEDMGADESQYRHRRLTGDSGIEVCRCRVEEEDEEEEEEEDGERKEDRRGGVGNTDVHDSVDCPARDHKSTGDGLALCTPTAATTPSTSDDSGKVVIVMETVS